MQRYSINKTKYLNDSEQSELIRIISGGPERDSLLIKLLLETGARAQEMLNIQVSDLSDADQSIYIKGIKGSNDREIPLSPELYERVKRFSSAQGSTGALFPISYPRLHQIWGLYRPVKKKLHSLRHTFAINLYKRSKDLRLLQVALGHRNINNTMVYAEYVYSQQELRKLLLP